MHPSPTQDIQDHKSFLCCLKKLNISNFNELGCSQKFRTELRILFNLAWPMCLSLFLQSQLMLIVVVLFCGHLGGQSLAIITLTLTFTDILGNAISFGLMSACDTLFAQTFGSVNKKRVGVVLQRSFLILGLFGLATSSVYLNAEPLLLLLNISVENARVAGICIKMFIICLPAEITAYLLAKYLECQGIVKPSMIMGFVVNIINACGLYLLLHVAGLGVYGAVMSVTISYYCLAILYIVYIVKWKIYVNTWSGFSKECMLEWGMFMKLAIPGAIMICIEWWSIEILAFFAGVLGEDAVAAQGVLYQIISLCYMWPLGIANATSIRVGNLLGGGRDEVVKTTITAGLTMTLCTQLTCGIIMTILRNYIGYIFTVESAILAIISETVPVLSAITVCDAVTTLLAGVLRGCGRQKFGAVNNLIGYYCIGLPIGLVLMYRYDMGVKGLWLGLIASAVFQAVVLSIVIARRDWQKETIHARVRAGVERKKKRTPKTRFSFLRSVRQRELPGANSQFSTPSPVEMTEINLANGGTSHNDSNGTDSNGVESNGIDCNGVESNGMDYCRKDSFSPLIEREPQTSEENRFQGFARANTNTQQADGADSEALMDDNVFVAKTPAMKNIIMRRVLAFAVFMMVLVAGILTNQLFDLTYLRKLSAAAESHPMMNSSTTTTYYTTGAPLLGTTELYTVTQSFTTTLSVLYQNTTSAGLVTDNTTVV